MVPLESLEGDADGVGEMLVKDEMYEEEGDVSSIGGATKAVGKGWIDGLPSVSRPVMIIWQLRQSLIGRRLIGDLLTPTVPGPFSGATVVGGD